MLYHKSTVERPPAAQWVSRGAAARVVCGAPKSPQRAAIAAAIIARETAPYSPAADKEVAAADGPGRRMARAPRGRRRRVLARAHREVPPPARRRAQRHPFMLMCPARAVPRTCSSTGNAASFARNWDFCGIVGSLGCGARAVTPLRSPGEKQSAFRRELGKMGHFAGEAEVPGKYLCALHATDFPW